MGWATTGVAGSERLMEYERRLDDLLARFPMTVLCQYDMTRFDGATAFATLGVHPMLLMDGRIVRNPYVDGVRARSARK
jgi:hypothetical protein